MTIASFDEDLAAEYVVGTLEHSERVAIELRIKNEPEFANLVNEWQNRLAGLNDAYDAVPAPNLLPKIEARLFPKQEIRRNRWYTAIIGFGLSAAAVIAVTVFFALPSNKTEMTATLVADNATLAYNAVISHGELLLTRTAGTRADAGKDYELWLIKPEMAPISLGVLDASYSIALPDVAVGQVLAITLEPKGGSPDGKPTGPIVAAGPIEQS